MGIASLIAVVNLEQRSVGNQLSTYRAQMSSVWKEDGLAVLCLAWFDQ